MFYLQNLTTGEVKTAKTTDEAYKIVSEWSKNKHEIESYYHK